jgi:cytochrome c-type biogenesis protein CcmH/NrfG
MSNTNNIATEIGKAWGYHRDGRGKEAAAAFEVILKQDPNNIDANYGLGLSQKVNGDLQAATQTFNTTLNLIKDSISIEEARRNRDNPEDNVRTPEDDRLMMLQRMVEQRIAEVQTN